VKGKHIAGKKVGSKLEDKRTKKDGATTMNLNKERREVEKAES